MASKSEAGADALGPSQTVEHGSHGGTFATILSAVALCFSGLAYYDSTFKSPDLSVFVPAMIHYARDGDADVFNVPITIANDGARAGTVLMLELDVENLRATAEKKTARFHSAFLGEYPRDANTVSRSFAPLSIPGHGTFTETVRFYPMDNALPFLVDDAGDYRFTLTLTTAKPQDPGISDRLFASAPEPLVFELNLPYLAVQHLAFRNGTQAMFNKDWKAAVSTKTDAAISSRSIESAEPPATPPPPGDAK